jgi:hypothetical protein
VTTQRRDAIFLYLSTPHYLRVSQAVKSCIPCTLPSFETKEMLTLTSFKHVALAMTERAADLHLLCQLTSCFSQHVQLICWWYKTSRQKMTTENPDDWNNIGNYTWDFF